MLCAFFKRLFNIGSSTKELVDMEQKLNTVLDKSFDIDKQCFVENTQFVPEMQTRVNEMLLSKASIEKANRVAELSVMLDRLQSYRSGETEELMLIPKKYQGESALHFNIVKVTNHSRRISGGARLASNGRKPG